MKIERLRNGRYKLIFLCGFILVVVLLILSIVFKGSKAKYRNTQVIPFVKGYITAKKADFTTMGIYLEDINGTIEKNNKKYTEQGDNYIIPSEGYVINEANSYCEKYDASKDKSIKVETARLYTDILGKHSIEGITKGSKCYIYLDKGSNKFMSVKSFLLNMWGYEDISTITERTDLSNTRSDGGNKVYKAQDDDGTSYYLVGQPENNWVKFAGFYWRIVRINGDGTLRVIYQGTEANTIGSGTQIQTSAWYSDDTRAEYAGYMFSTGVQRGFNTSSIVKEVVDKFYADNLNKTDISKNIDKNAGFCSDRSVASGTGYGTSYTNFRPSFGTYNNKSPILTCPSNDDLFTVSGATKGNGKLTYPVGLITVDEVLFGGMVSYPKTVTDNMYYTNQYYWTISPSGLVDGKTRVMSVRSPGYYSGPWATDGCGVRPVINLVKDIKFSKGEGTSTNPFEI